MTIKGCGYFFLRINGFLHQPQSPRPATVKDCSKRKPMLNRKAAPICRCGGSSIPQERITCDQLPSNGTGKEALPEVERAGGTSLVTPRGGTSETSLEADKS